MRLSSSLTQQTAEGGAKGAGHSSWGRCCWCELRVGVGFLGCSTLKAPLAAVVWLVVTLVGVTLAAAGVQHTGSRASRMWYQQQCD